MQALEDLRSIKDVWMQAAIQVVAHSSGTRENAGELLANFWERMEHAIENDDPAWLDPILYEWAKSLTQSDLEGYASNLSHLIKELSTLTYAVISSELDNSKAVKLIGLLLSRFGAAFERAAQLEMEAKANYLTDQLDQVKLSLEKLDRSKSDFISVAAHELKTPLTLIDGYASMLRENLEQTDLPSYQSTLIEGIQTGTRRLRTIIDDMIDVSLIDNNLLSLNFQPVWVNRLFSVIRNEFADTIKARNLRFEIQHFPGYEEMTFGDPERLLQVIRNIILNAIKYTPDGGGITINGRKLPGFVEIIVQDTGIGIDPEDTQAIFEKFVRLGNTALHSSGKTKFKGGGPGLGLHIAKGIIESHGGTIWVESPGHDETTCPGSTFHLLIPLRQEPPDAQMAKLFAPLLHQTKKEEAKS